MRGEATPVQIAALLIGLRVKGETAEEIAGAARALREAMVRVEAHGAHLVDTCGTGSGTVSTFNISTAAAFVAAGAGATVAKHGNRSMTSQCGSADVLEALGVKISLPPEGVAACLEEAGIGFMFAQLYHPAMKFAAGLRREIGIRTIFNILGPLTNPAGANAQVLGVASPKGLRPMAETLLALGTRHALVVHGDDRMGEVSICAPTQVVEVQNGDLRSYEIAPEDFGFARAT